jgi:hypothetical protein
MGVALWAAGCGGNHAGHTTDDAGMFYDCSQEMRAWPYSEGMMASSPNHLVVVKLLRSEPGPPIKGTNTWTVAIAEGAAMTPLGGLAISVTPFMPDHRHGSPRQVLVTAGAEIGAYTLAPVYFFMGGYWEVTFDLGPDPAGSTRTVMLPICIPG